MSVRGSPRSRPPRSHLTFKVPALPHVTASMKIQTRWQSASIRHWLPTLWSNSTLCFLLHEAVRLRAVVEPAVAVEPDSLCDGLQTKQKGYHLHRQHFYPLWEIEGGECLSVPLCQIAWRGKACRAETLPPLLRFWVYGALGPLEMDLLLSTSTAAHDACAESWEWY